MTHRTEYYGAAFPLRTYTFVHTSGRIFHVTTRHGWASARMTVKSQLRAAGLDSSDSAIK